MTVFLDDVVQPVLDVFELQGSSFVELLLQLFVVVLLLFIIYSAPFLHVLCLHSFGFLHLHQRVLILTGYFGWKPMAGDVLWGHWHYLASDALLLGSVHTVFCWVHVLDVLIVLLTLICTVHTDIGPDTLHAHGLFVRYSKRKAILLLQ